MAIERIQINTTDPWTELDGERSNAKTGTSSEASDFAARNHIGLGVSFGPLDVMGKVTGYYRLDAERARASRNDQNHR